MLRPMLLSFSVLVLAACGGPSGTATGQTGQSGAVAAAPSSAQQSQAAFTSYLERMRAEALSLGVSDGTIRAAFAGVTAPDPSVVQSNESQPEFVRPVWEYLSLAVSERRVAEGRQRYAQEAATIDWAARTYGVDAPYLVSIWGLESGYGANMGSQNVIRSLATLGYQGRRSAYGTEQLLAALRILDAGDQTAQGLVGSWAGAMGQTQFIPTTYLAYAVDGSGDGRRDIWSSLPDVFASTANYLSRSGWRPGEPSMIEVTLPPGFDYAQADTAISRTGRDWQAAGLRPAVAGRSIPADLTASLLLPAGHRGPAFLTFRNFGAILAYNNSTSYAMAVSILADRIAGGDGRIAGSWPTDSRPLTLAERRELQELLNRHGFEAGGVDGIVGANTRRALRSFQQAAGLPADGFADDAVLRALRAYR